MFNALFVLIVFMLTLNKDILHIDWPFGVKTNITITDDNQVATRVPRLGMNGMECVDYLGGDICIC